MSMICVNETGGVRCGHEVHDHDSGGCCKIAFCPCSKIVVAAIDPGTIVPGVVERAPERPAAVKDYFLDLDIAATSFADLAVWAYKAQAEIKRLRESIQNAVAELPYESSDHYNALRDLKGIL
jgi:hypothetical protein